MVLLFDDRARQIQHDTGRSSPVTHAQTQLKGSEDDAFGHTREEMRGRCDPSCLCIHRNRRTGALVRGCSHK
jgi:hypothetical protein